MTREAVALAHSLLHGWQVEEAMTQGWLTRWQQTLATAGDRRCGPPGAGRDTPGAAVLCQKGWFLAKVRDAIRMATWTRRIRRFLLNNGAASPSHPCAGKHYKTSKPPPFHEPWPRTTLCVTAGGFMGKTTERSAGTGHVASLFSDSTAIGV